MMKTCSLCLQIKPLDSFHRHSGRKDGRTECCKECACKRTKEWKEKNINRPKILYTEEQKAAARARTAKWRNENLERAKSNNLAWREANKEKMLQYKRNWQSRNREKVHANTMMRRAKKLNATPAWANKSAIEELYGIARDLCVLTGRRWEVDHIIPLRGRFVSGLHVEANLQVIPMEANRSKANKHETA